MDESETTQSEKQQRAAAYEAKRQERLSRLQSAADSAKQEASRLWQRGHDMASVIPFGQPILVGHHSERTDRNYRSRIDNTFRKASEMTDHAAELQARAISAAKNTAIFSDDPLADEKIEAKIARLEQRQEMMKEANKLVRKNDREGLAAMGFSETSIIKLFTPDFAGRLGFPDYAIKNNNANIRRLKERLTSIQANQNREYQQTQTDSGTKIEEDPDDNRIRIFFPGKPAASVIAELKSHGFHWTPSLGCWQRQLNNTAKYWAELIVKKANA